MENALELTEKLHNNKNDGTMTQRNEEGLL